MISPTIFDDYQWRDHACIRGRMFVDLRVATLLIGLLLLASSFRQEAEGALRLTSAPPTGSVSGVRDPHPAASELRGRIDPHASGATRPSLPRRDVS